MAVNGRPERRLVVRVDLRVELPTGNRHVRQSPVDQVLSSPRGVDVDQHPIGGLTLAAVTGDGVGVIEMQGSRSRYSDGATALEEEAVGRLALRPVLH